MTTLAALLFLAMPRLAPEVITVSGNFPRDLLGPVDTRMAGQVCAGGPCIWGNADFDVLPIHFRQRDGYRVRIVSLRGDLIAWIKSLPGDRPTPLESAAGVLAGFQTTSSLLNTAVADCDYCSAGCPLYIQDSVTEKQPRTRAAFNYENVSLILEKDNTLHAKIAAWLNTTGKPIHLELTYTIGYVFEPDTD